MKHKVFKKHELIFKTSVFKFGKYPLQTYKHFDPQDNRINLQFNMGPVHSTDKNDKFYIIRLQQFINKNMKDQLVQKIVDGKLELKLSHMETWDYPVYKVITSESGYKPWVKQHKPTSKDDL